MCVCRSVLWSENGDDTGSGAGVWQMELDTHITTQLWAADDGQTGLNGLSVYGDILYVLISSPPHLLACHIPTGKYANMDM